MNDADRRRLIAELEADGLSVTEWQDEAGTSYPAHAHPHREVRIVLEGSMSIMLDASRRDLGPGDRIDLAPGEGHAAIVGPQGVRYLAGTGR